MAKHDPPDPQNPPWTKPAAARSIPTAPKVNDPDRPSRPTAPPRPTQGAGRDPTIFVGGVAKPKKDDSEVLLVDSTKAYVAVTGGPRKGAQFTIQGEKMLIGREPPVDLLVEDSSASRRHAQIYRKNGKWYLKDLGSTNGTYLDGPLRASERILWDGDVFKIGEWEITFSDPNSRR